jgi:hypothetical protein
MARACQKAACNSHRFVGHYGRLKLCPFGVQAHTRSSADSASSRQNSRIHPLRPLRQSPHPEEGRSLTTGRLENTDSPQPALFFKDGRHRIFGNAEVPADIPDATAIQRLGDDLIFDARLTGIIGIVMLKAAATGFASIALRAIFIVSIFR